MPVRSTVDISLISSVMRRDDDIAPLVLQDEELR